MKTTIDYLRFRTQADPLEALEALKPMFGTIGSSIKFKPLERGVLGFQQAASVCIDDLTIGRMDFGGESQRGWVRAEITGQGCEWVQDWDAVHVVEELPKSQLRRLDIALTTWNGEITHETVVNAHKAERFQTGGRPPALQQITSTDERAGKTCYVGKRTGDKFFRAYEKGFEMASKFRGVPSHLTHIEGFKVENIYRCEVELKGSSSDIPWQVIEKRDQYFAGSYPFCSDVLPGIESDILQRRKERAPRADLEAALQNCRIQYGATLFTALHAHHGDINAVFQKILGNSHCERLLESGVLLVDHD